MSLRSRLGGPRTPPAAPKVDEDELLTSGHASRLTTRPSSGDKTVYSRLRQLSNAIQEPSTPQHRQPGTSFTSIRRVVSQTPTTATRDQRLNRPPRPVPTRKGAPTTPHALRALEQRRAAAALTPGRGRRRSGRQQHETPRDILRKLSRVEAAVTEAVRTSPHLGASYPTSVVEDDQDELGSFDDLPKPRLSVPLEGTDEDSFQAPPRLSFPGDEDSNTIYSVEQPRRDRADLGQYNRDEIRVSDRFAGPLDLSDDSDIIDERQLLDASGHAMEVEGLTGFHPSVNDDTSFAIDVPDAITDSDPQSPVVPKRATSVDSSTHGNLEFNEAFGEIREEPFIATVQLQGERIRAIKPLKRSRHGIDYPSLPKGIVKKMMGSILNSSGKRSGLSKDVLLAVSQVSDWYFEQLGDDLGAYATHAGKRTIDDADVVTLMRRQRLLTTGTTAFSLAQRHLPRELIEHVKMTRPIRSQRGRQA